MKIKMGALVFLSILATSAWSIDFVATIISQESSPLTITSYSAKYQRGSEYAEEGIRHAIKYKNTSKKKVVAVQFGLVSFDVWNEFIDRTGGVGIEDIASGSSKKGTWMARAYSDFSFLTGFAYVSKVRFEDGEIWEADLDDIAEEMQKIEEDFDVQNLKGKPGNE
ncbi:MAG: hypothetical protein L3K26_09705 [Candidatus Hydrogenedentes bacterium]|nr:hypothetical protein [Candidatus Hydrogenedentota bacterium]